MRDFDELFSIYLETYEADEIFNGYFSAIRKAYIAGYKAAGGIESEEQPICKLVGYADKTKNNKR